MVTIFVTVLGGLLATDMIISVIKHAKKGKTDLWVSDSSLREIRERYASYDDEPPNFDTGMDWEHDNIQNDNMRKLQDFRGH